MPSSTSIRPFPHVRPEAPLSDLNLVFLGPSGFGPSAHSAQAYLCMEKKGLARKWLKISNDLLKQFEGAPELLAVIFGERGEGVG
jgi:hypothetical protein